MSVGATMSRGVTVSISDGTIDAIANALGRHQANAARGTRTGSLGVP